MTPAFGPCQAVPCGDGEEHNLLLDANYDAELRKVREWGEIPRAAVPDTTADCDAGRARDSESAGAHGTCTDAPIVLLVKRSPLRRTPVFPVLRIPISANGDS